MSAAAASCHHKILLSEDAIEYDSLEDRRERDRGVGTLWKKSIDRRCSTRTVTGMGMLES